jgi:hypothetical protein
VLAENSCSQENFARMFSEPLALFLYNALYIYIYVISCDISLAGKVIYWSNNIVIEMKRQVFKPSLIQNIITLTAQDSMVI